MKRRKKKINMENLILDIIIYTMLIAFTFICLYPVWYVIVASFSNSTDLMMNPGFMLWPKEFVTGAYKMVFENPRLMTGFINSVKYLAMRLPINIILTLLCGYFMACTGMKLKKPITALIMFTMFFGGGMIPTYMNIRDLGMYDTMWALILPGSFSVYNAIICKTAIEGIPESLAESAYIDGANDLQVLFRIITPLIKPTLAVLLLYYGVGFWNSWFNASIWIRDNTLLPVQNIIRQILIENKPLSGASSNVDAETIQYAAIVISTFPIMCVYPFLQKYFTKGVMIGAVKG